MKYEELRKEFYRIRTEKNKEAKTDLTIKDHEFEAAIEFAKLYNKLDMKDDKQ